MTDRIEKSILLRAPLARVWRAVSNHEEFGAWFRVRLDGPFVPGKTVSGKVTYPGYEHVTMTVHVERVEEPRELSFRWHPAAIDPKVDYSAEPMTLVTFTLSEEEAGTRVRIVESGFDALPAARREAAFRSNDGGWATQLENIKAHVAGS